MNVAQLVQDVIDGNESPLKAYAIIKEKIKHYSNCLKEIEGAAIQEAEKYEDKKFEASGYVFEFREGRATYNYKYIPEWVKLNAQLKEIEEKAKAAARNYGKGVLSVTDDGEEILPAKVNYSKPTLIVKVK